MTKCKSKIKRLFFVIFIINQLSFTACLSKGYLEPENQPYELVTPATLKTPSPLLRNGKDLISISTIDGARPTFTDSFCFVTPGKHQIEIEVEHYHESSSTKDRTFVTKARKSLTLFAEAGKSYVVNSVENGNGLWIWISDEQTGSVISGERNP